MSSRINWLSLVCAVASVLALAINILLLAPRSSRAEAPGAGAASPEPPVLEPASADALVNSSFSYQGQLKLGGAPVNGSCDFFFSIFDVSTLGVALATDTDLALPVTNGLFTATVDVPATAIDGNARWLDVQVRCPAGTGSYTTLTPRQYLRAAPYALGLRLPFSHTISNSGSPIFAVTNTSTATNSPSFLGSSAGGDGVRGLSTGGSYADNGVYGETNSTASNEGGVKGVSTSSAPGGYFTSTSGAAIYASGDVKQSLAGNGLVKAGVSANCSMYGNGALPQFNNVNSATIAVTSGASHGRCSIDFGFDVSERFIIATGHGDGAAVTAVYYNTPNSHVKEFIRYDSAGAGLDGGIDVLVY